jgi:hypothetical protein
MNSVKIIKNPLKTILLEGNLKDGRLRANLCTDYLDIHTGNWNVSIKDLSYDSNADVNQCFNISTTFVTGKHLDEYSRIRDFQPPLQRIFLGKKDKQLIRFDLLWFTVNNPSTLIELNFQL